MSERDLKSWRELVAAGDLRLERAALSDELARLRAGVERLTRERDEARENHLRVRDEAFALMATEAEQRARADTAERRLREVEAERDR